MNKLELDRVIQTIDGYRDEAIRLQTDLTAIPALGPENDGEGEDKKADYLKNYLRSIGIDDIREYNAPDSRVPCGYRPNVVATLGGKVKEPAVWIMAHTDVVPPGDLSKWTGDPYTVRVEGDRLIGRGVEDNQSGMVASLLAIKAFKETGIVPHRPLGVVLVADEETGSAFGLKYVVDHHKHLFKKNDIIIVPDAGNPKGSMIEVAEKSILWIKFHTKGRQTHGSTPEKGRNAHKAACYLTTRLETLYNRFKKRDQVFDPPISTFEPTKKEANVPNVNTIPGEDVLYFDCRVLPFYKLNDVLKVVKTIVRETEKKYKVKISTEYPQHESAAPPTPTDAPVVLAISRAVRELRNRRTKPMGIGGGTVAKFFRDAGFPCAVWGTMDEVAHTADEYALLPAILDDAKVFAHIALQDG
ncbi:MAG: M20 family metallo-hydrolase [Candidatus Latescibacteria bacterium]|nr:M20 family metallo-hydrolase [Candidatus Latescibacterota bacterium]NIM64454.1 M20 family metallo-hydrolase [Candidatus Latescibacterota bacterium]NIO00607.1 M20 family metallo-hydrolase [Candidatus Latescibacterota bacterium]NIO27008.1 M20 family metallo-hydrolase [Candidatus Latescibacterota bacterium]NIO56085.1 M20 family metallo-hydrolase [Candidatus Latescibacterota bacterium]